MNSYVYDSPGFTGGCVMNGTPSWSFGSSSPWKWMAVDSGSSFLQDDAHAVAFAHADLRTGDLVVVRPRLDHVPGLGLPLDLLRGELEDLHAVRPCFGASSWLPLPGGLRGKCLDALLVHRVHRSAADSAVPTAPAAVSCAPIVPPPGAEAGAGGVAETAAAGSSFGLQAVSAPAAKAVNAESRRKRRRSVARFSFENMSDMGFLKSSWLADVSRIPARGGPTCREET